MGSATNLNSTGIDEEFLEKALGNKISSFSISEGTKPGDNYASVIYSIQVNLENKSENDPKATRHLLIKCYPSHPSRQEMHNKTNTFHRELEVYRFWLPEFVNFQSNVLKLKQPYKLPFAEFVAGKSIDFSTFKAGHFDGQILSPLDNFIMMDDLRKSGYKMANRREPLDIHHMRIVISTVAKVHALSWVYKNKVAWNLEERFPFLSIKLSPEDIEFWIEITLKNVDDEIKLLEKAFGEQSEITNGARKFKGHLRDLIKYICGEYMEPKCNEILRVKPKLEEEFPEPWIVMIHGDFWTNNMLFKYELDTGRPVDVVFVDLQLVKEGCLTNDLMNILYTATRTQFRKEYLSELLELYFDTFNEVCATCDCKSLSGFTLESLKTRFHRMKPLGLMYSMSVYPVILREESKSVDLEQVGSDQNLTELLGSAMSGDDVMNDVFVERILEVTQEMYEERVI